MRGSAIWLLVSNWRCEEQNSFDWSTMSLVSLLRCRARDDKSPNIGARKSQPEVAITGNNIL